jgi:hypothetical protein
MSNNMSNNECICGHFKNAHTEDESRCLTNIREGYEFCDCHGFTPEDGYAEWND